MVVMSRTTQLEYVTGRIDGVEDINSISEKIGSGRAFLKVVAYQWGVEFEICEAEGEV
jgi:hypothetical protein